MRSLGGHLCGVLRLPENGRRSFVYHCLEPRSKRRDRAELQANVRHFELSRKRIAARMRTCQCMSHFVYNLRSRPLVRDLAARVRSQIASDHCRSDLITGRTQWARAGYPFPEVNLPELFFTPTYSNMYRPSVLRVQGRFPAGRLSIYCGMSKVASSQSKKNAIHVDLGCHHYTYFTCGVSFA